MFGVVCMPAAATLLFPDTPVFIGPPVEAIDEHTHMFDPALFEPNHGQKWWEQLTPEGRARVVRKRIRRARYHRRYERIRAQRAR